MRRSEPKDTVECQAYGVCHALGLATGPWCRYHLCQAPPPGTHSFDPKQTWCPPALRSAVIMLAYVVSEPSRTDGDPAQALGVVREWAEELRHRASTQASAGATDD